jgi:hypothetical protein
MNLSLSSCHKSACLMPYLAGCGTVEDCRDEFSTIAVAISYGSLLVWTESITKPPKRSVVVITCAVYPEVSISTLFRRNLTFAAAEGELLCRFHFGARTAYLGSTETLIASSCKFGKCYCQFVELPNFCRWFQNTFPSLVRMEEA